VAGRPERIALHHLARARREQQLLLRRQHLGAVDRQHRLALPHHVAGEVDEHAFDPSVDAGVHVADPGLVGGDTPDRANRARARTAHDRGERDADGLLPLG
jgi:hypothetical protein